MQMQVCDVVIFVQSRSDAINFLDPALQQGVNFRQRTGGRIDLMRQANKSFFAAVAGLALDAATAGNPLRASPADGDAVALVAGGVTVIRAERELHHFVSPPHCCGSTCCSGNDLAPCWSSSVQRMI